MLLPLFSPFRVFTTRTNDSVPHGQKKILPRSYKFCFKAGSVTISFFKVHYSIADSYRGSVFFGGTARTLKSAKNGTGGGGAGAGLAPGSPGHFKQILPKRIPFDVARVGDAGYDRGVALFF